MDFDATLFLVLNGLAQRSGLVDGVMLALGHATTLLVPGGLALAYWLWLNRRAALIGGSSLAVVFVLGDLVGAQVKHLVGRMRPCQALAGVRELAGCGGTFSFPSNHALNTAVAAAFLQVLYPATGWVTWPVVALVGFSRVYVGAHYVTDVLGGWAIGGALGAGAALLVRKWLATRREPERAELRGRGRGEDRQPG